MNSNNLLNIKNETNPSERQLAEKLVTLAKKRVDNRRFLKKGSYEKYVEYLRSKPAKGPLEKHHIKPRHQGGTDDPSNLISIGKTDHILAHLLLFLEKGEKGDLLAYALRRYSKHVDLSTQSAKARALDKILKRGWFNSEIQRLNGLKGGLIGGAANTSAQFSARSKVGKAYGRQTGIGNQSETLKDVLKHILFWEHKDVPNTQIVTQPAQAALDIIIELNAKCDEQGISHVKIDVAKAQKGGFLYSFLKGQKPTYFGWRIVSKISQDLLYDD